MELNANKEKLSINTKKAYASDLAYIQRWAHITFENFSFPMAESAVLLFITDHLQGMEIAKERQLMSLVFTYGYKAKPSVHSLATVYRRLSTLTKYHKEQGYDDPCFGSKVKDLLRMMSKTKEKAILHKAVTEDIFEKLLATCDGSVKGFRDRAILLLVRTIGCQRGEVSAAQIGHLTSIGDDFLLQIPASNSKGGQVRKVLVKNQAAQALRDWIAVAAIKQGDIFRAVNKCGKVSDNPLWPIDVNRIVKNRCKAAGLNEKEFTARGLRSDVSNAR